MRRINMPGFQAFETYLSNLFAYDLVAFGGYFLFGGLKRFRSNAVADPAACSTTKSSTVRAEAVGDARRGRASRRRTVLRI